MASTPTYPDWYEGHEIDLVSSAIVHLRSIFPEASIHPSSVEAALLESLSVVIGPTAVTLQGVQGRVVDHLMTFYGLERYPGYPAEGKARFTVSPSVGQVTIPAGTVLRHYLSDNSGLLEYRTVSDTVILTSETLVGEATIEATTTGTEHNGLPVGSTLDVIDYHMYLERVEVSEAPRGGEGPESDVSWRQRSMALLSRQVSTLVVPDNFMNAALSRPEVGRATVLDQYNPDTPTVKAPGHVSVAVTDSEGLPLTPREKPELEEWLEDQALASLEIHVVDPTYTDINPAVVVEAKPGETLSVVQAGVEAALRQWLNPATWEWWKDITPYDFVSTIDDVPGVDRVVTVPGRIVLNGSAPLPRLGTMTVTVNESSRGGA